MSQKALGVASVFYSVDVAHGKKLVLLGLRMDLLLLLDGKGIGFMGAAPTPPKIVSRPDGRLHPDTPVVPP